MAEEEAGGSAGTDEKAAASRDAGRLVRSLLERQVSGVLSTLSQSRAGHPFGSGVSFALSRRGAPLLLISELAVHTRNLRADGRACLFVSDPGDEAQAVTRASLLGRAAPVPDAETDDARTRYRQRFPDADRTFALGGFSLWELAVEEIRWIEGFGRMGWLDGASLV